MAKHFPTQLTFLVLAAVFLHDSYQAGRCSAKHWHPILLYCTERNFRYLTEISCCVVQNRSYRLQFGTSTTFQRYSGADCVTTQLKEYLVWNLISYNFQFYETYEIYFHTKISSFIVLT